MSVMIALGKSGIAGEVKLSTVASVDEHVVLCPKCKTFETLCFDRDGLIKTRKFFQLDNHVYHDCGSPEPCRLYRIF